MARVLIIGGTVFVGRAVAAAALARGDAVTLFHLRDADADLGDWRRKVQARGLDPAVEWSLLAELGVP